MRVHAPLTWAELQGAPVVVEGLSAASGFATAGSRAGRSSWPPARLDGPGILVAPGGSASSPGTTRLRAAVLFAAIRREACRLRQRTGSILSGGSSPVSPTPTAALCAWVRPARRSTSTRSRRTKRTSQGDGRRPRPDDLQGLAQRLACPAARGRSRGVDGPGLRRAVPSATRRDRGPSGVRRGAALLRDGPGGDPLPGPDGRGLLLPRAGARPRPRPSRSSSALMPRTFTGASAGGSTREVMGVSPPFRPPSWPRRSIAAAPRTTFTGSTHRVIGLTTRTATQFKRHFGGTNRVYAGAHDLYSYDRIADAMLLFLQHLGRGGLRESASLRDPAREFFAAARPRGLFGTFPERKRKGVDHQ